MNIRCVAAIVTSKFIMKLCRVFKWGGTSLPGKIALKIYPRILGYVTTGIRVIMVTGTNGKTTTTGIIARIFKENGISCITNKSGANLIGGIASVFIEAADYTGGYNADTAVIEVDEAAFETITEYMEPDILIVTNFFRDQLDRYGELYGTLKRVAAGIGKTKNTKLVLNADDSLCASLGTIPGRAVTYYGFNPYTRCSDEEITDSDAPNCIYCKTKYSYTYRTYGHLGGFYCPQCGYRRPNSEVSCTRTVAVESDYSVIEAKLPGLADTCVIYINLPGRYNIYNALAGIACGYVLGLPEKNMVRALSRMESAFGRMETVRISEWKIKLVLIKNPAGLNQVLDLLLSGKEKIQLAFVINDRYADSTDISWLWDADFEMLLKMQDRIGCIFTSGTRCDDMAIRLKYAGIPTDKIVAVSDYDELIQRVLTRMSGGDVFYILPTYTAMQDIRKVLKRMSGIKEFWE